MYTINKFIPLQQTTHMYKMNNALHNTKKHTCTQLIAHYSTPNKHMYTINKFITLQQTTHTCIKIQIHHHPYAANALTNQSSRLHHDSCFVVTTTRSSNSLKPFICRARNCPTDRVSDPAFKFILIRFQHPFRKAQK